MKPRVLVTGASSGIGLALAQGRAETSHLLLTGRRDSASLENVLPPGATYVAADQAHPLQAAGLILEALAGLGWDGLDLAILNAGTGLAIDPVAERPEDLRATLDTNLVSAIVLVRALQPWLERNAGRLVLIGSTAWRGAPGFASYAASKAALDGFARSLAEEWRGRIAVQIVHPGPTRTAMHERAGHDPGPIRKLFARPETMAQRIEAAIRSGRTRVSIPIAIRAGAGKGRTS